MPNGNRMGGRGQGQGQSMGGGRGQCGSRIGGSGMGMGGECVCTVCGARTAHQRGIPCSSSACPKCGAKMARG